MTATLTLRVYTGTGAATESSSQTAIVLCAADALSGGNVIQGTVSYERWLRLRVDSPPATGVANFYVENTGALPAGVAIKFGVTDTPATPKNTASTVATMDLAVGRHFIFDTNTYASTGDHTRYLVLQEVVAADAASGTIPQHSLKWGWAES